MGFFDMFKKKDSDSRSAASHKKKTVTRKKKQPQRISEAVQDNEQITRTSIHEKQLAHYNEQLAMMNRILDEIRGDKEYMKQDNERLRNEIKKDSDRIRELIQDRDKWKDRYWGLVNEHKEKVKIHREVRSVGSDPYDNPSSKIVKVLTRTHAVPQPVRTISGLIHRSESQTNKILLRLIDEEKVIRKKVGKGFLYSIHPEVKQENEMVLSAEQQDDRETVPGQD